MAPGLGHWYVEVEKQAYWRGQQHTWVNRYVMSGADPTVANAGTVALGLKTMEGKLYPEVGAGSGVGFIGVKAYASTGGAPIYVNYSNEAGTPSAATGFPGPTTPYSSLFFNGTLENCVEVTTLLTGLSSTGKPVYLRKYYRGMMTSTELSSAAPIASADITAINATVAEMKTGISATSYVVIGVSGRLASGNPTAQPFIGNHQVPRGRKRKSTAADVAGAYALGLAAGEAYPKLGAGVQDA